MFAGLRNGPRRVPTLVIILTPIQCEKFHYMNYQVRDKVAHANFFFPSRRRKSPKTVAHAAMVLM